MHPCLCHRLLAGESLSAGERRALVEAARRLRSAGGTANLALAGCHVVVATCDWIVRPESRLFEEAAHGLGAHVSRIGQEALRPGLGPAWNGLLARLYDAIDCEELSSAAALNLERTTGVPVFNGLDVETHPLRSFLADMRDKDESNGNVDHGNLVTLVQAVLIEALA